MTGLKYLQLRTIQRTTIAEKYENKLETLRFYLGSQQVYEKEVQKSFYELLSNKQTTEVVLRTSIQRPLEYDRQNGKKQRRNHRS